MSFGKSPPFLDQIVDVSAATPTDGYVLTWVDSNDRWEAQAAPGSGGGEANTASNQGVGGVGLYDTKAGIDLQFRNINAADGKITVSLDAVNKEVDIGLGSVAFNDLSDVVETSVANGDLIYNNGSNWVNANINDFTADASPDGAADYVLTWDASASAMKKVLLNDLPGGGGGASAINDLSDVTITSVASGELLAFTGTVWENQTLAEAGVAAASHTHATSDITSGTFADARIAESNVTQHQAAIDHDALTNFVANEHIDWTGASSNFSTTGTALVDGSSDAIQLRVQGHSAQTANIFEIENSAATNLFTVDNSGNVTVAGTVDGRDLATDGSKLDGIEASADVTDETNVVSSLSGATLTGVTVATTDKVLLQDVSDADNLKTVTAQSIANLVSDTTVAGDSGSTGITPGDTLTIAGGTNCTTAMSGDTLTVNVDDSFLSNTGDTGTGVYDFGGATSLEIPNSAAPTVNADGEIAIDTTVTDFSTGIMKYYGGEEMGVVAMPIAEFTSPTDGHVVAYNAANDEFELVAGGGGSTPTTTQGDMIRRGASADERLALGNHGYCVGSDGTDAVYIGPSKCAIFWDDFFDDAALCTANTASGGSVAQNSAYTIDGCRGHVLTRAGSTIGSRGTIQSINGASNFGGVRLGDGIVVYETRVLSSDVQDANDQWTFRTGIFQDTRDGPGTDGVYFEWDYATHGNNNWHVVERASSTDTATDTGVAVSGSWQNLRFVMNAAGTSVEFFIDGVSKRTEPTSFSGVNMDIAAEVKRVAYTSNTNIDIITDYFYCYQEVDRS